MQSELLGFWGLRNESRQRNQQKLKQIINSTQPKCSDKRDYVSTQVEIRVPRGDDIIFYERQRRKGFRNCVGFNATRLCPTDVTDYDENVNCVFVIFFFVFFSHIDNCGKYFNHIRLCILGVGDETKSIELGWQWLVSKIFINKKRAKLWRESG